MPSRNLAPCATSKAPQGPSRADWSLSLLPRPLSHLSHPSGLRRSPSFSPQTPPREKAVSGGERLRGSQPLLCQTGNSITGRVRTVSDTPQGKWEPIHPTEAGTPKCPPVNQLPYTTEPFLFLRKNLACGQTLARAAGEPSQAQAQCPELGGLGPVNQPLLASVSAHQAAAGASKASLGQWSRLGQLGSSKASAAHRMLCNR